MIDLSPDHFSEPICPVDVSALAVWLEIGHGDWIVQPDRLRKPQRLLNGLPMDLVQPLIDTVRANLWAALQLAPVGLVEREVVLSRMQPGQVHDFHQDQQPHQWLTRVHVPITTNPFCWHQFEGESPFEMFPGHAYTFNAVRRHSFGNDGTTPRVHLIFDVLRTA